jgi:hypothetical protein
MKRILSTLILSFGLLISGMALTQNVTSTPPAPTTPSTPATPLTKAKKSHKKHYHWCKGKSECDKCGHKDGHCVKDTKGRLYCHKNLCEGKKEGEACGRFKHRHCVKSETGNCLVCRHHKREGKKAGTGMKTLKSATTRP